MAKLALGFRRFLAAEAGLAFLMPSAEDFKKYDNLQKEQKEMAEKESKKRDIDEKLEENNAVIISDDEDDSTDGQNSNVDNKEELQNTQFKKTEIENSANEKLTDDTNEN